MKQQFPAPTEGPLSICMVAACPFPANHGTPGAIREMAEAIVDLGHRVDIVSYHFGEDIPVRGPSMHRIRALTGESKVVVGPTIRKPLYDLQLVFAALEVIRSQRSEVIHAHGYEAALVAWCCRLVTGLPVLYSGHNTMADELPAYEFIRPRWLAASIAQWLDASVPRLATRCLPHSANIEAFFRREGLGARMEPVIPFGIEMDQPAREQRDPLRARYGLNGGPVVVYAGVLDRFQRLDLLLEALARVVQAEPTARLLIVTTVGQRHRVEQIRRQAAALGIVDRVVCTDPQPLASVRDHLSAADVAVVPRPGAPGFPIKLLNYWAASKPCVLFASSASHGLIHGENAFLVGSDSADALAAGILAVIRDPLLSERLATLGCHYVRAHHDRRLVARQLCESYRRLRQDRHRPDSRHRASILRGGLPCNAFS